VWLTAHSVTFVSTRDSATHCDVYPHETQYPVWSLYTHVTVYSVIFVCVCNRVWRFNPPVTQCDVCNPLVTVPSLTQHVLCTHLWHSVTFVPTCDNVAEYGVCIHLWQGVAFELICKTVWCLYPPVTVLIPISQPSSWSSGSSKSMTLIISPASKLSSSSSSARYACVAITCQNQIKLLIWHERVTSGKS